MHIKIEQAADKRWLASATFRRESPKASEPLLEAIFQLHWPGDLSISSEAYVVMPLTVTRTDTREPVKLTANETTMVLEEVICAADRFDD